MRWSRLGVLILVIAARGFPTAARAQDCVDYAEFVVVPATIELPGPASDLVVADHQLWVAAGDEGLLLYRIEDPFAPELLAHIPTAGAARAVALAGGRAYVAAGAAGGLEIFDVRDPAHVVPLGRLPLAGDPCDVEVLGSIAYVATADTAGGLAVVDASDPAAPVAVATVEIGAVVKGIEVAGNVLLAAESTQLAVLDLTSPAAPVQADTRLMNPPPILVSTESHYAFVLDHLAHVRVVDFADPYALTGGLYGTSIPGANRGVDIATEGRVGLVLDNFGLEVLDLSPVLDGSHPEGPVAVASIPVAGSCVALDAARAIAYVGGEGRIQIVELDRPLGPPVIATQSGVYWPHAVAASGDTLYFVEGGCCYWARLVVVDAANPDAPAIVSESFFERGGFIDIALSGHHAFIADQGIGEFIGNEPALRVIDISDPAAPVLVGSLVLEEFWNQPMAVAVDGDLALMTTALGQLLVLDVSTPAAPRRITTVDLSGPDILLRDARAILAGGPGLIVLDMSDPGAPKQVATLSLPVFGRRLVPDGDLLYVLATPEYGAGTVGVHIVDLADPDAPVLLGSLTWTGRRAGGLAVGDGIAYMTLWEDGLRVLDVSSPSQPRPVGGARLLNVAGCTVVHRGRLLVSLLERGLGVLPLQCAVPGPVELASFTALMDDGGVVLRWTAARAADHLGYRIERSGEVGAFAPIGPALLACASPCAWRDDAVLPDTIYRYRLVAIDTSGAEQVFGPLTVRSAPFVIWSLGPSRPNPGRSETVIPFAIGAPSDVRIGIYDVSGRLVRMLCAERRGAGESRVTWDGRDDAGRLLGAGVYVCRLDAGSFSTSRKVVLAP